MSPADTRNIIYDNKKNLPLICCAKIAALVALVWTIFLLKFFKSSHSLIPTAAAYELPAEQTTQS